MANYSEQYDQLFLLSQEKGYITYDDMLKCGENLSPADIDRLSESLQLHGVLLQEFEPENVEDEDLTDFSRTDYEAIYKQVIALEPNLRDLILEIKKFSPVQKGTVPVLTAQISNGNSFAREQLIKLHMRLVIKIALSMTKQYDLNIEDAIFSGFIGLIEGIDSFDRNGFNHLMQNISFRILQKIQRECVPNWFSLQMAYKKRETIRYIYVDYKNHYCESCTKASICPELEKLILQKYNLSSKDACEYLNLIILFSNNKLYIDQNIDSYDVDYGMFLLPVIAKNDIVQEKILHDIQRNVIEDIFREIPHREAKLLQYRYGFLSDKPYTLEECGKILGITKQRARQIEQSAISHIKTSENYKMLLDFASRPDRYGNRKNAL